MQAVLVMFRSDGERRSFSITRDVTVIGRREDCDLRIPLGDISRKHARLIKEDGQLRIEDLGSSNGTHLNGQRIERDAVLQAGDSIQVGPVVFVLQMDGYPADDELNPITAESAAAAAMFAPSAVPTAPGMAPAPLAEDPTLDLGGGYEQPMEGLGEEQPAEEQYAPESELDALEPLDDAPAEEFEPLPLDDAPLDLGEEPLELLDEEPVAAAPPRIQPPPMRPPPMPSAPVPMAEEEPIAIGDDEPIALGDDEPIAMTDDEPLAFADDQGEAGLDLLEDLGEQPAQEEELMIDFDEPEKK